MSKQKSKYVSLYHSTAIYYVDVQKIISGNPVNIFHPIDGKSDDK